MKSTYEKIETKRKILVIVAVIFFILLISSILLMGMKSYRYGFLGYDSIYIQITLPLVIIFGIIMIWLYKKIAKPLKVMLMNEVAQNAVKNGKYFSDLGISVNDFVKSNFIKRFDKYTASDAIMGETEDNEKFYMCNIEVDETQHKGTKDEVNTILFKGIFGILETRNKYKFDLNIVPDVENKYLNQIFSNLKKMFGVGNIVRLENPEFERYFEVYSSDQIEARKIITVKFMENLLKVRKKISCNMYIMYSRCRVYFFIPDADIIKARCLTLTGITKKVKEESIESIKLIIEAVNSL